MHWKQQTPGHSNQHRHRHAEENHSRRGAEQRQAFQRQPPPIVHLGAPGAICCHDQGGETLDGGPDQDERGDHGRLLARVDDPGDSGKNVILHLVIDRHIAFNVGNDLRRGDISVNKGRDKCDKQDHQRKQREKRIESKRSRPLCAVNEQKFFNGKTKYRGRLWIPGHTVPPSLSLCHSMRNSDNFSSDPLR